MQQIQLNIIPFKPVVDNKNFGFYGEKQKGFAPIYWDKLFELFPVRRADKTALLRDGEDILETMVNGYQFICMYWKSISQQNLPVTIKYPEMVAEIFPYFTHDKLPDHGKESLWFL